MGLFLTAAGITFTGACLIYFIGLHRRLRHLCESLEVFDSGLVLFDHKERFYSANGRALKFFPALKDRPRGLKKLRDFLNYMFDHAVECDESLRNALLKNYEKDAGTGFREVIRADDEAYGLAEVRKTGKGGSLLTIRDLSQIKKDEETILNINMQNMELREAIDNATNGIVIIYAHNKECPLIFANRAFCRQLDRNPGHIIGRSSYEVLSPFLNAIEGIQLRRSFEEFKAVDFDVKTTWGSKERWFDVKFAPLKGSEAQKRIFIGVFTETTEVKLQEAQFFQAQKLESLGHISSGMAHEFNNILAIIEGYAHMLKGKAPENETVEEYAQKILKASDRGASLTRKMLMFSRHKLRQDHVLDINKVVKDLEVLLIPLIDKTIDFQIEVSGALLPVECDPDDITQIMMNLTVNARDAIQAGGKITIGTSRIFFGDLPPHIREKAKNTGHDYACLYVEDNGSGMEPEIVEKIFDPFFTTKETGEGTGLGLSMIYGLVRQIGGFIDVETQPGSGTTMFIYLPLRGRDLLPQAAKINDERAGPLNLQGLAAMVVEDEPDLLLLMEEMVRSFGMKVLSAAHGDEALLKHDDFEGRIDFLITDIMMPGLDGVSLAQMFQELREETKVVFISGYPAQKKNSKISVPSDAVLLAKPVKRENLLAVLMRLAGKDSGDQAGLSKGMQTWQTNA